MDLVNAIFESLAGFFILASCRRLYIDKRVRGVSWLQVAFFTSWGIWNLVYYPSLGQWLSFAGGVVLAATNLLYLSMMIYYIKKEDSNGQRPEADEVAR